MGGITLRDKQREFFFQALDKSFLGLREKYMRNYGNQYFCSPMNKKLNYIFKEECKKYGLLYKMEDIIQAYKKKQRYEEQRTLFDFND